MKKHYQILFGGASGFPVDILTDNLPLSQLLADDIIMQVTDGSGWNCEPVYILENGVPVAMRAWIPGEMPDDTDGTAEDDDGYYGEWQYL